MAQLLDAPGDKRISWPGAGAFDAPGLFPLPGKALQKSLQLLAIRSFQQQRHLILEIAASSTDAAAAGRGLGDRFQLIGETNYLNIRFLRGPFSQYGGFCLQIIFAGAHHARPRVGLRWQGEYFYAPLVA